jgi:hypothetical protein
MSFHLAAMLGAWPQQVNAASGNGRVGFFGSSLLFPSFLSRTRRRASATLDTPTGETIRDLL